MVEICKVLKFEKLYFGVSHIDYIYEETGEKLHLWKKKLDKRQTNFIYCPVQHKLLYN